ncbi:hypothetical protein T07_1065 [Trichinella nelsoni]|uniref:Uncharacterized protein n=1 Tax=Trichinella nelsoni TaxID=6336 RepID=A0A0V0RL98_9BILA|nr:hypothetical protein T07_1065 [Trichinella nelsoni]
MPQLLALLVVTAATQVLVSSVSFLQLLFQDGSSFFSTSTVGDKKAIFYYYTEHLFVTLSTAMIKMNMFDQ